MTCFIMTIGETDTTDLPESYRPHLSKTGRTYGLSFCIGNTAYLGKGFAALTLESFMKFLLNRLIHKQISFLLTLFSITPVLYMSIKTQALR